MFTELKLRYIVWKLCRAANLDHRQFKIEILEEELVASILPESREIRVSPETAGLPIKVLAPVLGHEIAHYMLGLVQRGWRSPYKVFLCGPRQELICDRIGLQMSFMAFPRLKGLFVNFLDVLELEEGCDWTASFGKIEQKYRWWDENHFESGPTSHIGLHPDMDGPIPMPGGYINKFTTEKSKLYCFSHPEPGHRIRAFYAFQDYLMSHPMTKLMSTSDYARRYKSRMVDEESYYGNIG